MSVEKLTETERESIHMARDTRGGYATRKALRIIDAQAARIAELESERLSLKADLDGQPAVRTEAEQRVLDALDLVPDGTMKFLVHTVSPLMKVVIEAELARRGLK